MKNCLDSSDSVSSYKRCHLHFCYGSKRAPPLNFEPCSILFLVYFVYLEIMYIDLTKKWYQLYHRFFFPEFFFSERIPITCSIWNSHLRTLAKLFFSRLRREMPLSYLNFQASCSKSSAMITTHHSSFHVIIIRYLPGFSTAKNELMSGDDKSTLYSKSRSS